MGAEWRTSLSWKACLNRTAKYNINCGGGGGFQERFAVLLCFLLLLLLLIKSQQVCLKIRKHKRQISGDELRNASFERDALGFERLPINRVLNTSIDVASGTL